jgi:hypothetical protein
LMNSLLVISKRSIMLGRGEKHIRGFERREKNGKTSFHRYR